MKTKVTAIIFYIAFLIPQSLMASEVTLLFGLIQPLFLRGYNVELDVKTENWVFSYSHGADLEFEDDLITGDAEKQQLVYNIPYTTGFGIGPRLSESFDLRLEFKRHKFEIFFEDDPQNETNRIVSYITTTLGLGFYHTGHPFDGNFAVSTSIRYWPNISSTLDDDKFTYQNVRTGQQEVHETLNIGIANTPWIFNVSIGYTF